MASLAKAMTAELSVELAEQRCMQYVVMRFKKEEYDLFSDDDDDNVISKPTIEYDPFCKLEDFLKAKNNPALLPIQISYYTGLRIGEVCGLTWQDINLDEQYLTVRRSIRYKLANGAARKMCRSF